MVKLMGIIWSVSKKQMQKGWKDELNILPRGVLSNKSYYNDNV